MSGYGAVAEDGGFPGGAPETGATSGDEAEGARGGAVAIVARRTRAKGTIGSVRGVVAVMLTQTLACIAYYAMTSIIAVYMSAELGLSEGAATFVVNFL